MNDTQHGPDAAAAHRRRHEQSHADAELYDNPAARQHPGEPVPVPEQAVTDETVRQAVRAWMHAVACDHTGHHCGELPGQDYGDDPAMRAALEVAAPAIRAAERDRIRQLAVEHRAHVWVRRYQPGDVDQRDPYMAEEPFADLIGGGS